MYTFSIHKSGITFTLTLLFLIIIISASVFRISNGLNRFLAEEERINAPQVFAVIPKQPVLRALAKDALIYSHETDIFTKREELIKKGNDFIFANLNDMSLDLYQKGELIKTFSIKAKGREKTFFETPSGLYKIQSKETNHFSSIGEVWMPWSMHFFGNYFVHGWPYYPNGTPVADSYSGGCIRLTTQDAKELFALTKNNIPILVYAQDGIQPDDATYFQKIPLFSRTKIKPNTIKNLSAISALAADFETGQILFEKQKDAVLPVASLTKLMTGLVALESIDRFKILTVTNSAVETFGNTGKLTIGDTFKSQDLLYPLILASSNDAATLYAQQVYGFIDIMNQKARAIGLNNTHYKEPTGLSPENVSTAQDLFRLLTFISIHKRPLFAVSGLPAYTLNTGKKNHTWKNTTWPDDKGIFIGGKSGLTDEARETLAAAFTTKLSEQGTRPIAIILLGSQDRKRDVLLITEYLEKNFVYGNVLVDKKAPPPSPLIHTGANVFQSLRMWVP
ncbi:MAG: L,D-transpeptidase family protein [bacterium]|nr:L,D-transpeptidase family protein [bacterium]